MPARDDPVTLGTLIAVLGVLYTPMGVLSGYSVLQSWEARTEASSVTQLARANEDRSQRALADAKGAVDKSIAALAAAGAARPDPFTGTMGRELEARVTQQQQIMATRCEHNIERLDNEIDAVEQRCIERFHALRFGIGPNGNSGKP